MFDYEVIKPPGDQFWTEARKSRHMSGLVLELNITLICLWENNFQTAG